MKQTNFFLSGDGIYFREVRIEDIDDSYYKWMNDAEVIKYTGSRFYPNSKAMLGKFVDTINANRDNVFFAIIKKENNKHIGNIKLGPINWINRFGDIGIIIGEKDEWGKGFASEAIKLMVKYAFNTLNLHKLTAGYFEGNKPSSKIFLKNGFQVEGVRKNHVYVNGSYMDSYLLGCINEGNKDLL